MIFPWPLFHNREALDMVRLRVTEILEERELSLLLEEPHLILSASGRVLPNAVLDTGALMSTDI